MITEGVIYQVNEMVWEHITENGEGIYFLRQSGHIWGPIEAKTDDSRVSGRSDDEIIAKIKIKRKPC